VKAFTATATREDEWWVVDVEDVGVTQGRTQEEAAHMATDLVVAMRKLDPKDFTVDIEFCNHAEWEHDLFDGCPPPLPPRLCCGAPPDEAFDDDRVCSWGCCTETFCLACGAFQGLGWGPVGCLCSERKSWSRKHAAQRPMRPAPGGRVVTRKYRARRGC